MKLQNKFRPHINLFGDEMIFQQPCTIHPHLFNTKKYAVLYLIFYGRTIAKPVFRNLIKGLNKHFSLWSSPPNTN